MQKSLVGLFFIFYISHCSSSIPEKKKRQKWKSDVAGKETPPTLSVLLCVMKKKEKYLLEQARP